MEDRNHGLAWTEPTLSLNVYNYLIFIYMDFTRSKTII